MATARRAGLRLILAAAAAAQTVPARATAAGGPTRLDSTSNSLAASRRLQVDDLDVIGPGVGKCDDPNELDMNSAMEALGYSPATDHGTCGTACIASQSEVGQTLVAVSFSYTTGDCYCQWECDCIVDDGDSQMYVGARARRGSSIALVRSPAGRSLSKGRSGLDARFRRSPRVSDVRRAFQTV